MDETETTEALDIAWQAGAEAMRDRIARLLWLANQDEIATAVQHTPIPKPGQALDPP